jgi:hypothetical protein
MLLFSHIKIALKRVFAILAANAVCRVR